MVALALDESHIIGIGIDYYWPISITGIHPMPIIVYYCLVTKQGLAGFLAPKMPTVVAWMSLALQTPPSPSW